MNKEQIKGVTKEVAGKVQETTGKVLGDKEQQIKGLQKQAEGAVEKKLGDAKEVIENIVKKS